MKPLLIIGVCFVFFLSPALAQECCRIVFYNVENLFDTRNDPLTADDEFTPRGGKHWSQARYTDKSRKIAEVIDSIGGRCLPVFIGLAEIENRKVLEDLTGKTMLTDGHYGIVHQDSPDPRGIDVAFLYQKEYFQLLDTDFLHLFFPEDTTIRTRNILYVKGRLGADTLHFFVCHFPSMIGGEKQSEWRRVRAASVMRRRVDSIWQTDPQAAVIIMGDMNGKANTRAQKTLGARNSDRTILSGELYNTGYYLLNKDRGSYRYKGRWQTIDHIIVSGSVLNGSLGWKTDRHLSVYAASFLLEEDRTYFGFKPRPTYRGPRYIGGYSDHLPVFLDIRLNEK